MHENKLQLQMCVNYVIKDDMDIKLLNKLINEILNALPGQIWDGKIKLFEALNNISKYCYSLIINDNCYELKENIYCNHLLSLFIMDITEFQIHYNATLASHYLNSEILLLCIEITDGVYATLASHYLHLLFQYTP